MLLLGVESICFDVHVLCFLLYIKYEWNSLYECSVLNSYDKEIIYYAELDRGTRNTPHCSKRCVRLISLLLILGLGKCNPKITLRYKPQGLLFSGSLHGGVDHCSKRNTLICRPMSTIYMKSLSHHTFVENNFAYFTIKSCQLRALRWNEQYWCWAYSLFWDRVFYFAKPL